MLLMNEAAATEVYTGGIVGSVRWVEETGLLPLKPIHTSQYKRQEVWLAVHVLLGIRTLMAGRGKLSVCLVASARLPILQKALQELALLNFEGQLPMGVLVLRLFLPTVILFTSAITARPDSFLTLKAIPNQT